MKNIIHIFGASGAGTSTLGRKICAELGYKFMDTDDYFWLPTDPAYTEKRPREERIELMCRDIDEAENVVISGSLIGWGDVLIPRFTLAIRVETDADIRAERLHRREKEAFHFTARSARHRPVRPFPPLLRRLPRVPSGSLPLHRGER